MSYLAIDIGGTKTLLANFSDEGKIENQQKFATPAMYDQFIEELAANIAILTTKKYLACVVAVPGKIDREKGIGIRFGNLAWRHVPIRDNISKITNTEVSIENDSKLAALSEAKLLPQYKKVVYITISTGIGVGVVINGVIDINSQDIEAGQMLLEHSGKLQRWEEFASGKAIVAKFGKRASDIDPNDHKTWYLIARNIAIGLIDVVALHTPDAIVIGGGVGSHFEKFSEQLLSELDLYANSLLQIPPILRAQRPEEAVIYGCFELAKGLHGKAS
jgi:predicted NBD/HSP70 family sugar kinase